MTRYMFVVPPLAGHTNPTVAVGSELASRGHDVAWCGYEGFLRPLVAPGARVVAIGDDLPPEIVSSVKARSQGLRGAAALKFLWEDFLHPLAVAMVPGVRSAVDSWDPDVLVVDQQAIAGALVARERGAPWATSATTSADLVDPFEMLPKLRAWVDQCLVEFQVAHGVDPQEARPEAMRFSDHLVIAFTTAALVGDEVCLPPNCALVGPALDGRPQSQPFPWEWLDESLPKVLVSLGTVNSSAGDRFFQVAVEALGDRPMQAVIVARPESVTGPSASPVPTNILVREQVPQLNLLPHLDAVISHGGHNTVCESLAHGVPLVVAPIRDDQPIVADQVERAGAGIRVKFARVRPDELGGAVKTVLDDPSFRLAAGVVRDSFVAAGGARAAADRLELLAASSPAVQLTGHLRPPVMGEHGRRPCAGGQAQKAKSSERG